MDAGKSTIPHVYSGFARGSGSGRRKEASGIGCPARGQIRELDAQLCAKNQNLNPDLTPKPGSTIQFGEIKYGQLCQLPATQPGPESARWYLFCLCGINTTPPRHTSNTNYLVTRKALSEFLFCRVIFEHYVLGDVSLQMLPLTFTTNTLKMNQWDAQTILNVSCSFHVC